MRIYLYRFLAVSYEQLEQRYKDKLLALRGKHGFPADISYPDIIEALSAYDPTPTKSYLEWVLTRLLPKKNNPPRSYWDDLPRLVFDKTNNTLLLSKFVELKSKNKLPNDKRDLNKIDSFQELMVIIEQALGIGSVATDIDPAVYREMTTLPNGKILLDDSNFTIAQELTHPAAKFWSYLWRKESNPSWCTGYYDEKFLHEQYLDDGYLYAIIDKQGLIGKKGTKTKYQFYYGKPTQSLPRYADPEFMDADDTPVTNKDVNHCFLFLDALLKAKSPTGKSLAEDLTECKRIQEQNGRIFSEKAVNHAGAYFRIKQPNLLNFEDYEQLKLFHPKLTKKGQNRLDGFQLNHMASPFSDYFALLDEMTQVYVYLLLRGNQYAGIIGANYPIDLKLDFIGGKDAVDITRLMVFVSTLTENTETLVKQSIRVENLPDLGILATNGHVGVSSLYGPDSLLGGFSNQYMDNGTSLEYLKNEGDLEDLHVPSLEFYIHYLAHLAKTDKLKMVEVITTKLFVDRVVSLDRTRFYRVLSKAKKPELDAILNAMKNLPKESQEKLGITVPEALRHTVYYLFENTYHLTNNQYLQSDNDFYYYWLLLAFPCDEGYTGYRPDTLSWKVEDESKLASLKKLSEQEYAQLLSLKLKLSEKYFDDSDSHTSKTKHDVHRVLVKLSILNDLFKFRSITDPDLIWGIFSAGDIPISSQPATFFQTTFTNDGNIYAAYNTGGETNGTQVEVTYDGDGKFLSTWFYEFAEKNPDFPVDGLFDLPNETLKITVNSDKHVNKVALELFKGIHTNMLTFALGTLLAEDNYLVSVPYKAIKNPDTANSLIGAERSYAQRAEKVIDAVVEKARQEGSSVQGNHLIPYMTEVSFRVSSSPNQLLGESFNKNYGSNISFKDKNEDSLERLVPSSSYDYVELLRFDVSNRVSDTLGLNETSYPNIDDRVAALYVLEEEAYQIGSAFKATDSFSPDRFIDAYFYRTGSLDLPQAVFYKICLNKAERILKEDSHFMENTFGWLSNEIHPKAIQASYAALFNKSKQGEILDRDALGIFTFDKPLEIKVETDSDTIVKITLKGFPTVFVFSHYLKNNDSESLLKLALLYNPLHFLDTSFYDHPPRNMTGLVKDILKHAVKALSDKQKMRFMFGLLISLLAREGLRFDIPTFVLKGKIGDHIQPKEWASTMVSLTCVGVSPRDKPVLDTLIEVFDIPSHYFDIYRRKPDVTKHHFIVDIWLLNQEIVDKKANQPTSYLKTLFRSDMLTKSYKDLGLTSDINQAIETVKSATSLNDAENIRNGTVNLLTNFTEDT